MKAAHLKNSENIVPRYKITRENNSIFSTESLMQRKYFIALFIEAALFHALSAVMQAKKSNLIALEESIYVTLFAIFLKS